MSVKVMRRRLEWLGRVAKMPDHQSPKQAFFGWLSESRLRGGPRRKEKDLIRRDLEVKVIHSLTASTCLMFRPQVLLLWSYYYDEQQPVITNVYTESYMSASILSVSSSQQGILDKPGGIGLFIKLALFSWPCLGEGGREGRERGREEKGSKGGVIWKNLTQISIQYWPIKTWWHSYHTYIIGLHEKGLLFSKSIVIHGTLVLTTDPEVFNAHPKNWPVFIRCELWPHWHLTLWFLFSSIDNTY